MTPRVTTVARSTASWRLVSRDLRVEKTRRNMAGEGVGKIFFLPKKKKPPEENTTGKIGAAHKATARAKAAADIGAAIAASMITVSTRKTFQVDNVHIALNRTKYAAAAAANKVAAAGWNMRIGTVACMPMDNNLNTIDAAVAAANIVAFALRTPLPPPPMRSPSQAGMCESAPPVANLAFRKRTTYAVAAAANRVAVAGWNVRMRETSLASTLDLDQRDLRSAATIKTMTDNAPTNPTSSPGIQGLAPSFYPRLGLCRRRVNIGGRSGDEWGPRWELAVGGGSGKLWEAELA